MHINFGFIYLILSDFVCIGESREDDKLLCTWSGCYDRGTIRIQCPKDHYPCNDRRKDSDYNEFLCYGNCDNYGGYRECHFNEGRSGLKVDVSKVKIGHKAGDDLEATPPKPRLDIDSCSCRFN